MSGTTPINQDRASQAADRRRAPRVPVSLAGFVRGADQALHIPCRIIDISATGARAAISNARGRRSARDLPSKVVLTFCLEQVEIVAEVRWDSRDEFGVKFQSAFRHLKPSVGKKKQFGCRLASTPTAGTA